MQFLNIWILESIFGTGYWENGGGYINLDISIELPVGISFYVLQSLGYVIDVYRKEIKAEKNLLRYGLFISFFPQLVAGPIERSKNLLTQLTRPLKLSWDKSKQGLFLIMWGMFIKLVIADRVAILVDTVYGQVSDYTGFYIIVATVFFAIQIYCDFYGYSTIARGTALFFGIKLMDNFKAPYYSKSVKEFWSRWHISLSYWFRDYLYIPLGGNKKGIIRKQLNRLMVFSVSGLWHGSSLSFLIWGLLNGIYQTIADIKEKVMIKRKKQNNFSIGLLKRIITFTLICSTWIFFRADGASDAINILKYLWDFNWEILINGAIFNLGISQEYFRVLMVAVGVLMYVDYKKYKGYDILQIIMRQEWWFQLFLGVTLLFSILLFGCYGVEYDTNQFIYFQF